LRRLALLAILALSASKHHSLARAAEIGIIARGDFEKVSDFYKRKHRVLSIVHSWSSGGEY
jgi:hypothetical protein